MITVSGVTKNFGAFRALDGLSLNVKKGSVYGLVGPNGAGKTTFIKALMGIYKADSGEMTLDGKPIFENEEVKSRMIYVCDDLFYYPTYTIEQTAKMYADIYPNWSNELFEKLHDIYKIDLKRKVIRLSKGMQKQVAFWLGISAQPDVMILDEPIDGLDPVMRRNTWRLVLNEVAERGMTVLISSHNLRELEDVCDHVGIMFGGKMVIEKSLDDVKGNIHKIQIAFAKEGSDEKLALFTSNLELLHESRMGSVASLIVKGDMEDIKNIAAQYSPVVFDIIPLTLEEVFIYELGGMGYEFENILI
ncbi:MAG: ABC transporter ATP-binding protein [Clostridia bacterium]|nr:ABC transporter ATP-binding protein [Clostridia bacterium]